MRSALYATSGGDGAREFRRELKAWQERVASMESTGAWRLRQRLVDLKQALMQRATASGGD